MDAFLGVLFIIICLLLIVVVLLQKGRGGGLGSAFGGVASSAFGTRIGDVFTWVTIVLVSLFLLLAIATTMVFRPSPETVARPYYQPPPAEYTDYGEPVSVKIGCVTPEAEIYYTTDGSVPTKESLLYGAAVRVEPGTVLKARAYRSGGWTPSPVQEGYYGPPPTTGPAAASMPAEAAAVTTQPAGPPPAMPASAPAE